MTTPNLEAREALNAEESVAGRTRRVLQENHAPLERLVASYAHSAADRDDLRQDIAVALWSSLRGFRGDCSERTFLLRIAHNRALTFITKRRGNTENIDDHAQHVTATSGKNPALVYERNERTSRLLAAVRALPVPHRQVMTLLLEGLSPRDIAEVLGTTENNVAVRANRARATLRILLEESTDRTLEKS